jgi:hypothetical protein
MRTDNYREHLEKPADAVRTSAGGVLESAGQGEAEAHEGRATDIEDGGETVGDNWVSAQCSSVFTGREIVSTDLPADWLTD